MTTETTTTDETVSLIDVRVPEAFPAKIAEAIDTLRAANLPALSEMIYRDLRPVMDDIGPDLFEMAAERSGWSDLFVLVTEAAAALSQAVGDQTGMTELPAYLTAEEVEAIRKNEMEWAAIRVAIDRGELTIPKA